MKTIKCLCKTGAFCSAGFQHKILVFFLLFIILTHLRAQNAIVGTGFSCNWNTGSCSNGNGFSYLSASAGSSYVTTLNANGTGNQYWRFGIDWSGTTAQWGISGTGADVNVSPGVTYSLTRSNTSNGACYYNVASASYKYIFKTSDAGTNPSGNFVFFEIQGNVQSVSSVTQNPATGNVYINQPVTVTANLSGSLAAGQAVYLRYSGNGYSSSAVIQMTGSGTAYTATIPGSANTSGSNLSYYVFTSGTSNVAANGSNADLYTINLNNNNGNNYSYTVINSYLTSNSGGNWSAGASWSGGAVPATGAGITIQNSAALNVDGTYTTGSITNNGTITVPGATTLNIAAGSTFTNNGVFTAGTGTVNFAGAATISGTSTINFNNITINSGTVTLSTVPVINGTLLINNGNLSAAPVYGSASTLKYNVSYSRYNDGVPTQPAV